jgi:hypothetical protein
MPLQKMTPKPLCMMRGKVAEKPVRLDGWIGDNLGIPPHLIPSLSVDNCRAKTQKALFCNNLSGAKTMDSLGMNS